MKPQLQELLDLEDNWLDREGLDEGDGRNLWLEEGIQLYNHFLKLDRKEPRYSIMLADLYLQLGRDEKMRRGNYRNAYEILRKATIRNPNRPDAFYHLSFILAEEDRKWEAVLFYGKEALEMGIDGSRQIKLLCNLALAYTRIGYPRKGDDLINQAVTLDVKKEHDWFIGLYMDKIQKKHLEPILLKENDEKRKRITNHDLDALLEDAMNGKYIVLNLAGSEKLVIGRKDTVRLEPKQAELLGYLMDNKGIYCGKSRIEKAVWNDQVLNPAVVKRYVAAIRRKLAQAIGRDDIRESVLQTTQNGEYVWNNDIPAKVLRKG